MCYNEMRATIGWLRPDMSAEGYLKCSQPCTQLVSRPGRPTRGYKDRVKIERGTLSRTLEREKARG